MPNASGRRYKQAIIGFKCWAPRQRPNYKKRDSFSAMQHESQLRAREQERRQRGYKGR